MRKSDRDAIKAKTNELIAQGIDKELAKVMAKAFFDCGLYKAVINYNK